MKSSHQNRRAVRAPWRVMVCAVLIGLVIYNPFCELAHLGNNPSYEQMARHRATVGASELQHFSPVSNEQEKPDADVEVCKAEPVKTAEDCPLEKVQPEVRPLRPEFFAGVWFRPPPSL